MTKWQVNTQNTDTPLGRGRPLSSRWIRKKVARASQVWHSVVGSNTRPHSVTAMQNPIATFCWERLHPPPYSPDLAPRGFYLFPALKKNLTGKRFGSNAEVKQVVKRFFRVQSPELFMDDFLKLIKWYGKCLNVLGTYGEI
ncbi:histone-lysine N-methyltransferase SETMAR [Trichonephila clavipes]|nr:histone-lysine N-methyltransferase SETMAR [Trichonephila clavipes]